MAFVNHFLNININFGQPRFGFNFGCFSMPNFFQNMPFFNCFNNFMPFNSFNSFSPNSWQQYINPTMYNTPSVFTTGINYTPPSIDYTNTYNNYGLNNTWQTNFNGPNFDTFNYSTHINSTSNIKSNQSLNKNKFSKKASYNGVLAEYNPTLGKKIATIALENAGHKFDKNSKQITNQTKDPDDFTGYCATYVKMAIRDAGAGDYTPGHAYEMTEILKNNKNFKQIPTNSVELKNLPAGTVLVYARGAEGYSKEYGHTEVITEDGRAVSDGITDNLYKKPSAIFIPITA